MLTIEQLKAQIKYQDGQTTGNFFLICGPCVIESEAHTLSLAREIQQICQELEIPLIFKASFDKANRTSINSYRGPGMTEGLRILQHVKTETGLPLLTDVHQPEQCKPVAEVVDLLQIPAFLCRQTDLLMAAGQTGRIINLKKGQFCSSVTVKHARQKVIESSVVGGDEGDRQKVEDQVMLCDRGTMFGYGDLIVDLRNLTRMREENPGCLIVQDITHALQQPNQGDHTYGARYLIPTVARAAVAAGVDGIFMEVHDQPEQALSDRTTQWPLRHLRGLLMELKEIHRVTRGRETQYLGEK